MFNGRVHVAVVAFIGLVAVLLRLYPGFVLALTPRCGLKLLTGLSCPFCGMTRDMAALAAGLPAQHNPASPALAALLCVIYPACVAGCLALRRNFPITPDTLARLLPPAMLTMFIANNTWGF